MPVLPQEDGNASNSSRPVLLQLPDNEEDDEDEDAPLPNLTQTNDGQQELIEESILPVLPQEDGNASNSSRPVLLQLPDNEEDDEDEDAPLPNLIQTNDGQQELIEESILGVQSDECVEALQAVESDCWDINSWYLFIDEVENGRGGTTTIPEAYTRFLEKFPRAAKQWKSLAEYHMQKEEYALAEDVYTIYLTKCRSVELWQSYVQMVQQRSSAEGSQKSVEAAFEKAIDNVGMSVVSHPLWVGYIEFIRGWPESDAGRKLGMTDLIYDHRILTVRN